MKLNLARFKPKLSLFTKIPFRKVSIIFIRCVENPPSNCIKKSLHSSVQQRPLAVHIPIKCCWDIVYCTAGSSRKISFRDGLLWEGHFPGINSAINQLGSTVSQFRYVCF